MKHVSSDDIKMIKTPLVTFIVSNPDLKKTNSGHCLIEQPVWQAYNLLDALWLHFSKALQLM
jgi:hypothetical protein